MTKKSSFKVSAAFKPKLTAHKKLLRESADAGMAAVVAQATEDAQSMKRWRDPGQSTFEDWEWTTTGISAESISGYIVTPRKSTNGFKRLRHAPTQVLFRGYPMHKTEHKTVNQPKRKSQAGRVLGVVTMYSAYAPWIQRMEIEGSLGGSISPGVPVVIEVFQSNWSSFYVPQILRPALRAALKV